MVFIGTGSIIFNDLVFDTGQLGIGVAFSIGVALSIFLFGKYSGAHINPAVTIALFFNKKTSLNQLFGYIFFQISGALFASIVLQQIFPIHSLLGVTQPSGTVLESFLLELLLTFLLMLVILIVGQKKSISKHVFWIIGLFVGLEAFFAGPICGASMNPARSIGPAIVSANLIHLWIYIIATTIGALLSVFMMRWINRA